MKYGNLKKFKDKEFRRLTRFERTTSEKMVIRI